MTLPECNSQAMKELGTIRRSAKSHRAKSSHPDRRNFIPQTSQLRVAAGCPATISPFAKSLAPITRHRPQFVKPLPNFQTTIPNFPAAFPIVKAIFPNFWMIVPNFPTIFPQFFRLSPQFPGHVPQFFHRCPHFQWSVSKLFADFLSREGREGGEGWSNCELFCPSPT